MLKQPRRTVDSRREIERLDAEFHFDAVCAVCAPYRTAFALESAAIRGKKILWQLDPYASNRDYTAPGLSLIHIFIVPRTAANCNRFCKKGALP